MKFILLFLFGLLSQISFSQCDNSLSFTEIEKESFVQSYLSVKKEKPKPQDESLYNLAAKHNISPQQFQEIQDPLQSKRPLTDEEEMFISDLQNLKEEYKAQLVSVEKKICLEHSLEVSKYQSMQHQYRSCMRFQRSLSNYFTKWMK